MTSTVRRDHPADRASVSLGVDHLAPHDLTSTRPPGASDTLARSVSRAPWHRWVLAGAALAAPLLMSAQYALDTAGLPREDPATYLGGVAADPGRYLLSTCVYIASMVGLLAAARITALGCGARAPRLAPVAAATLCLGALGGMGFAGLRLTALSLVDAGHVPTGAAGMWERVQTGAAFDVLSVLLLMAILGTLLATAAMVVARRDVTWWAAPLNVVGFVLASGEFSAPVSILGGVVTLVATLSVVRAALRVG